MTPLGSVLRGKIRAAKHLPIIMMMHNCEYEAMAFMEDYYRKLDKAMAASKQRMVYHNAICSCHTEGRFIVANLVPFWAWDTEERVPHFTRPEDNALLVETYLKLIGKYCHLDEDQITYTPRKADNRIAGSGVLSERRSSKQCELQYKRGMASGETARRFQKEGKIDEKRGPVKNSKYWTSKGGSNERRKMVT